MDFDDNTGDDTVRENQSRTWKGRKLMFSRQAALIFVTLVCLGGPTSAHAQATFGQPVAGEGPDEFGLKPPSRDALFRVQSEHALKERLRQELPQVKNVDFPKDAVLPKAPGEMAPFAEQVIHSVSGQVCYRPLYFEDKQTERFGKYVPCVQPLLSAGRFYGEVVFLPCRLLLAPPWTFECDNR